MKNGDIITIDVVIGYKGYQGDAAWTYAVGEVDSDKKYLMEHTEKALYEGLKMVKPGGYFATCSCSHYMSEEQLKKTVLEAAHDARRTLRQIEVRTQSSDHPILWNSDESYYLKFFIFQVV